MPVNSSNFLPGDKVVAYCRYSGGEEQGLKNTSTDEQEAAIRRFCDDNQLILVKVYADPFVSGRSTKGREHYLEMMSDLLHDKKRTSDIAGLIAWDFERLHRNMDQAQLDAARLRMAGYKIYSLQQPVMDTGPFARVIEAMYFASAQNQSDMISADVRRALRSIFQKYKVIPRSNIPDGWIPVEVDMGCYSNGKQRIGYKAEPDPELAPKIRQAIEKRLQGATIDEMKIIIGGPFAGKQRIYIKRLMTKPLLYGQMSYGGETMEDYCEPIIDQETFNKLQLYNQHAPIEHERPQAGHYSKNRPLLSGMLYCGVCGKKAFLNRRTSKGHLYETYYCNDKHVGFRREILDDLVIEKGIELLSEKQYQKDVRSIVEGLQKPFSEGADNSSIEAEIAKIDRKIERISAAIEETDDVPVTLIKRLAELEKERANYAQSINADDAADPDLILEECDCLRKYIVGILKNGKSTTDELRNALSFFIHSVVIYPESRVLIRHTLPGFAEVASISRGEVTAPPEAVSGYSQLLGSWFIAVMPGNTSK